MNSFGKISLISLGAILSVAPFTLTGCGNEAQLMVNKNLQSEISSTVNDLISSAYNKSSLGSGITYDIEGINEKIDGFKYYVELGETKNFKDIQTLSMNGLSFNKDDKQTLSIGNNNFIKANVWFEDANKIYVSAPILAFESSQNSKIKINDQEFMLNLAQAPQKISFTNVFFQSGSTNTISPKEGQDKTYDAEINQATKWLGFKYDNSSADDIILTKKVLNYTSNGNEKTSISYGLTSPDKSGNDYVLAFYPVGYKSNIQDVSIAYNSCSYDYSAYIDNQYIATAKVNITVNRE